MIERKEGRLAGDFNLKESYRTLEVPRRLSADILA